MENTLININKIGLKFLEPLSLRKTYNLIAKEGVVLLGADWGSLYIIDTKTLDNVAKYPIDSSLYIDAKKNKLLYKTSKEKNPFVIPEKDVYTLHPDFKKLSFTSALCIPLADHKKSIGIILLLFRQKKKFISKDLDLIKLFGSYASLAIRKAKLFEDKQQALETRDFFISMAAHELRTPLTAVNGYIQLLYTRLHTSDTNEAKWTKSLLLESRRLTVLINELLEVDRIKTGEFQYQWDYRNLKVVIERAINTLTFTFPKRTLIYEENLGKESDVFVGDFDKILQAVNNLLDNAAKFSPSNTDIILRLSANKTNLIVTIQDFGSGIPTEILPKIYEGYAVHRSNGIQGMGLGMYLVKNVLRLHKGTIKIKTKEKVGTTVQITLPKA